VVVASALDDYLSMDAKATIPEDMKALLRSCLSTDPQDRPSNFQDIANTLTTIYQATTDTPYPRTKSKAAADTADSLNNWRKLDTISYDSENRIQNTTRHLFKQLLTMTHDKLA